MNLYELAFEYREAEALLNEAETNEEYQQALDHLTDLEVGLTDKVDNIASYIRNLDGDINKFKEEENRLADKRKTMQNKQERLKKYLMDVFAQQGIDSVQGERFQVKIQNNSQWSMAVSDESNIPAEYFEKIPTLKKGQLKKDIIENGLYIEGVTVSKGQHLRIR